jgi:type VI secretion system protein ImpM
MDRVATMAVELLYWSARSWSPAVNARQAAGAPVMIGLFGKIPRNGDFIRRQLPDSFVGSWDHWLRDSMATARDEFGPEFAELFLLAPTWFYRVPDGSCGPTAAAGALLPSRDSVGRVFPLTIVKLLPAGIPAPDRSWYHAIEDASHSALERDLGADHLLEELVAVDGAGTSTDSEVPAEGWWTRGGRELRVSGLPPASRFSYLLREDA